MKRVMAFVVVVASAVGLTLVAPPAASASDACNVASTSDPYLFYTGVCARGSVPTHTAGLEGRMVFKPGGNVHPDPRLNVTGCTLYYQVYSIRLNRITRYTQNCVTEAQLGGLVNFSRTYNCGAADGIQVSQYAKVTDGYGSFNVGWGNGWSPTASC
jgi:hypothetical protein